MSTAASTIRIVYDTLDLVMTASVRDSIHKISLAHCNIASLKGFSLPCYPLVSNIKLFLQTMWQERLQENLPRPMVLLEMRSKLQNILLEQIVQWKKKNFYQDLNFRNLSPKIHSMELITNWLEICLAKFANSDSITLSNILQEFGLFLYPNGMESFALDYDFVIPEEYIGSGFLLQAAHQALINIYNDFHPVPVPAQATNFYHLIL